MAIVACENTDRELWRGPDEGNGSYYADSIFITTSDALGINCGGSVYVKPIREWHRLAGGPINIDHPRPASAKAIEIERLIFKHVKVREIFDGALEFVGVSAAADAILAQFSGGTCSGGEG